MRVAIFTTHPIQYQAPWFRALASEAGLDVKVFFSYLPNAREQAVGFGGAFHWDLPLLDGYEYAVLPGTELPKQIPAFLRRPRFGIGAALADFNPQVALILGWQEISLVQALGACLRRGTSIIMRGETNSNKPRNNAVACLHGMYLRHVDAVLAIGKSNAAFYCNAGVPPNRIIHTPYFIDNDRFCLASTRLKTDRSEIRKSLGIPESAVCALFAGKLERKKRPFDFIAAIGMAAKVDSAVHGLVVGSGALRQQLETMARMNRIPVVFTGFLNQLDIVRAYVAADFLVLPSDYDETWGLVVNEAMATGIPAIVSDRVGCADDLVVDGQTGSVVPFASVEAIASIISRWTQRPHERLALGRNGQMHVLKTHSIERAVWGLREAIEIVLRNAALRNPIASLGQQL